MHKIFRSIFFILVLAKLTSHAFDLEIEPITKSLLMPTLLVYFITSGIKKSNIYWLVISALAMSWLGDILLIFQNQKPIFFIAGLASFLIAHLIYTYLYSKVKWDKPINPLLRSQKLRHGLILTLTGLALVYILLPGLGDMKVPVMIYAAVLVTMVISALLRYGYTSMKSFGLVFGGAILFMISDSLLAIDKFREPIPLSGVWIMLTYCLAQFLIVEGIKNHLLNQKGK
jgi:uncharacterized membrane protein YhhN